ncbi:hypothetical protein BD769DRAFT_1429018 [Suillus cothurnatus]|nr:hypothetical protein BD769DRAFT_1429018 [Suillus cothurnatus]
MLDNHAVASDKAALEDAFGIDGEDGDDISSTNEFDASSGSPLWTKVDFSRTQVANSPSDSPPTHSVISMSPTSSPAPSPSALSSLTLSASDSDVSASNVDNSPQQATSVISDNKDNLPSECQAPLIKSVEDEIRLIATPRFLPLINLLLLARSQGEMKSSRSTIAVNLVKSDKDLYKRVGVTRFAQYTALAEQASLVKLTTQKGSTWIEIHPNLFRQNIDLDPGTSSTPPTVHNNNSPTPPDSTPYTKTPIPYSGTTSPSSTASPSLIKTPALNPNAPPFVTVPIPLCFQPLIACLTKVHNDGIAEPLRSAVGQALGFDVYSQVGTTALREYFTEAIDAGVVKCGHNWVKLHPDVRSGKRSC